MDGCRVRVFTGVCGVVVLSCCRYVFLGGGEGGITTGRGRRSWSSRMHSEGKFMYSP